MFLEQKHQNLIEATFTKGTHSSPRCEYFPPFFVFYSVNISVSDDDFPVAICIQTEPGTLSLTSRNAQLWMCYSIDPSALCRSVPWWSPPHELFVKRFSRTRCWPTFPSCKLDALARSHLTSLSYIFGESGARLVVCPTSGSKCFLLFH